jgi:hypothetical protein
MPSGHATTAGFAQDSGRNHAFAGHQAALRQWKRIVMARWRAIAKTIANGVSFIRLAEEYHWVRPDSQSLGERPVSSRKALAK